MGASGLCSAAGAEAAVWEWALVSVQAAAGFSGLVSALLTERSAFTCLPHVEQATDHFLPQISSPKEGLTMCIHQRNY